MPKEQAVLLDAIRRCNHVIATLNEDTQYEELVMARLTKHELSCKLRSLCRALYEPYELRQIVK